MGLLSTKTTNFIVLGVMLSAVQPQALGHILQNVYIGCFKDKLTASSEAAMNGHNQILRNMTPEVCTKICANLGFPYAGLQDSNECHCGYQYEKYGSAEESECMERCQGNTSLICGGRRRNSVYRVCPPGKYGLGCYYDCPWMCNAKGEKSCDFQTGQCLNISAKGHSNCHVNCSHNIKECDGLTSDPPIVKDSSDWSTGWIPTNQPRITLYPTLTFERSGRISSVEYKAVETGTVYISFWRRIPERKMTQWTMVSKVKVEVNQTGSFRQEVTDDIFVSVGDALAIHYPTNMSIDKEIIASESSFNHLDSSAFKPYLASRLYDDGWNAWKVLQLSHDGFELRIPPVNISLDCVVEVCGVGMYGPGCIHHCLPTCVDRQCSAESGECTKGCVTGWMGSHCNVMCSQHCSGQGECNRFTGQCKNGCLPGYTGIFCKDSCAQNTYGLNCSKACHCKDNRSCHPVTGECTSDPGRTGGEVCAEGWTGCSCSVHMSALQRSTLTLAIVIPMLLTALAVAVIINSCLVMKVNGTEVKSCVLSKAGTDQHVVHRVRFSDTVSICVADFEPYPTREVFSIDREKQPKLEIM